MEPDEVKTSVGNAKVSYKSSKSLCDKGFRLSKVPQVGTFFILSKNYFCQNINLFWKEQNNMKKDKFLVKKLTLSAIMTALATVLSIFPTINAPFGGSITIGSMLPIMLISIILGSKWGIPVAICYSFIQLALEFSAVASWGLSIEVFIGCLFLDYILAFSVLCTANIFGTKTLTKTILGVAFAGLLRFLCHFLSGWLFFGMWAQEGFSAFTWAIVYNGAYMIPDTAICIILTAAIYKMFPTFQKQIKLQ